MWKGHTMGMSLSSWNITISGLLMLLLDITLTSAIDYECNHYIRDEPHEGRGVKRVDISCLSGSTQWHGPYGGLFINIQGPQQEHQLCFQSYALHTQGVLSIIEGSNGPRRLVSLNETVDDSRPIRHTVCLPAHGDTLLFVEADIDGLVSSKIIVDYHVETKPRYGEDACRPCSDEELLYYYCSSDFVGIGQMAGLKLTSATTIIPVSLDIVKRESVKYFTQNPQNSKAYTGNLYTPSHCKMEYGSGKFVFMGIMKFDRMQLRCAPTYEDFQELQRTSKLKGTALCT